MLEPQRLAQQGVVQQVDLADREVVGGAPVGVDLGELGRRTGGRRRELAHPGHRAGPFPRIRDRAYHYRDPGGGAVAPVSPVVAARITTAAVQGTGGRAARPGPAGSPGDDRPGRLGRPGRAPRLSSMAKAIARADELGRVGRDAPVCRGSCPRAGFRWNSVAVTDGYTTETCTPAGASSEARDLGEHVQGRLGRGVAAEPREHAQGRRRS